MTERKHKTVRLIDDGPYEYMIDNAIDRAIAAIEGEAGLVTQLVSVHHSFRIDGVCFVTVLADVERPQMKTKEAEEGFAIHPLLLGEEMALKDLRPGAIFMTSDGKYAVKSKHYSGTSPYDQYECVLLSSGEYAQFTEGNWTRVREVRMV
jgi:hypothetical protein